MASKAWVSKDMGRGRHSGFQDAECDSATLRPGRHGSAVKVARKLLWEAARRARAFPRVELHDPQWMMLLELFIAAEEQRVVNVKTLCLVSQVPSTTAARHLTHLERQGMVSRRPHPADARSSHVALMPRTRDRIRLYLNELDQQWLTPAPPLVHH